MIEAENWFRAQTAVTSPGRHAARYAPLPTDLRALRDIVQGLILHVWWAPRYGVAVPDDRRHEVTSARSKPG
jgi:hypothetical protein